MKLSTNQGDSKASRIPVQYCEPFSAKRWLNGWARSGEVSNIEQGLVGKRFTGGNAHGVI
jgi:hypothetical protein